MSENKMHPMELTLQEQEIYKEATNLFEKGKSASLIDSIHAVCEAREELFKMRSTWAGRPTQDLPISS